MTTQRVLLSGGVGGARLCDGFYREFGGEGLLIAVNTGDDFEHLGLHISPDIDSVLYALADLGDRERGWGMAGESWTVLERLRELGGETWFQLGDRDLATHLLRTSLLRSGESLPGAVATLCERMGIAVPVVPVTDQPLRTHVRTDEGVLAFQDYFVRRRCEPTVSGFEFRGAESAQASAALMDALTDAALSQVVICPSNPFVSVGPMLALSALSGALTRAAAPVVAVSPIVGGRALKGPAAAMLTALGYPLSALGVVRYYADTAPGLLHTFVIDSMDSALIPEIETLVPRCLATEIVMHTPQDRRRLARWLTQLEADG